ncbi:hypothetical protein Elgi_75110 [Paenibacillus elgii]|nr:hypothetical protein Elgi_75110 [Paenibacillus elgii]
MSSLLQANTERQRIAAEMITSLAKMAASMGGDGINGGSSHSQDGAKINYFDKTRDQSPEGDDNSGNDAVASIGSEGEGERSAYSQNPAALAATWGDGEARSSLIQRIMDGFANDIPDTLAADKRATKKPQPKELNIAGEFKWVPSITDADEITQLKADRWSPGTNDFIAVAGGEVITAPTFTKMLGAIVSEADGSISRINLFTHGNWDSIALGGYIQKRSSGHEADVQLNMKGAIDTITLGELSQPGKYFDLPKGKKKIRFHIDDVRKKFTEDAIIVLYSCYSGQSHELRKAIAQFFQIKVIGFRGKIMYYPPVQNVPHKFKREGEQIGVGNDVQVADWRDLIHHSTAITELP